jgi:hypothetical protein
MSDIGQPEAGETVDILLAINVFYNAAMPFDEDTFPFFGEQRSPGRAV